MTEQIPLDFNLQKRTSLSENDEGGVFCVAVTSQASAFFYDKANYLRRYFIFNSPTPDIWTFNIQLRVTLDCTGRTKAQGNETPTLQVFNGVICSASIGPGVYCKSN